MNPGGAASGHDVRYQFNHINNQASRKEKERQEEESSSSCSVEGKMVQDEQRRTIVLRLQLFKWLSKQGGSWREVPAWMAFVRRAKMSEGSQLATA